MTESQRTGSLDDGGVNAPDIVGPDAEDELKGLKEMVQVAAEGPVAEMTPFGVLVTIFIPWTRVSSMLNDEPKE